MSFRMNDRHIDTHTNAPLAGLLPRLRRAGLVLAFLGLGPLTQTFLWADAVRRSIIDEIRSPATPLFTLFRLAGKYTEDVWVEEP
jgi:hypothetical protein